MILFADDKYIPQIKLLWKQAFGDADEFIDFYFKTVHKNENMIVCVENGRVLSMLTMLPIEVLQAEKRVCGRYIYAVATLSEARGRGLSTSLLEYAHGYMREHNESISVLVPATEPLFEFYEKRGYTKAFFLSKTCYKKTEIEKADFLYTFDVCSTEDYYSIREKAFAKKQPFAAWDKNFLEKIMMLLRAFGGEFYKIVTKDGEAAVCVEKNKGEVLIKELASINIEKDKVISALHERIGEQKYVVCGEYDGETIADFAMIRNLKDENIFIDNAYFNLALD